jgi:hypothetical protein
VQAVLFYLIAYAVMNIGAFGVAIAVNRRTGAARDRDYAGLASRSPLLAMAMTVFLLSLGGAPPTVGLWAKFAIVQAALTEVTPFAIVLMVFLDHQLGDRVLLLPEGRQDHVDGRCGRGAPRCSRVQPVGGGRRADVGTVVLGVLPGLISSRRR